MSVWLRTPVHVSLPVMEVQFANESIATAACQHVGLPPNVQRVHRIAKAPEHDDSPGSNDQHYQDRGDGSLQVLYGEQCLAAECHTASLECSLSC